MSKVPTFCLDNSLIKDAVLTYNSNKLYICHQLPLHHMNIIQPGLINIRTSNRMGVYNAYGAHVKLITGIMHGNRHMKAKTPSSAST